MTWKASTFLLAGLLVAVLIASYVITCDALRRESAAVHTMQGLIAETNTARNAIHDTKSFLNFFRLNDPAEMTTSDYERHIKTLHSKFLTHFPEWGGSQAEIEFGPSDKGE